MTFAEYTRNRRIAAGLTLEQTAAACDLGHRSKAHRRENGVSEWRFDELVKLARLHNQPVSEFVAGWERTTNAQPDSAISAPVGAVGRRGGAE